MFYSFKGLTCFLSIEKTLVLVCLRVNYLVIYYLNNNNLLFRTLLQLFIVVILNGRLKMFSVRRFEVFLIV